jgi:hypothetical protein
MPDAPELTADASTPTTSTVEESAPARVKVALTFVRQHVVAEAFGSPSEARRIGATLVDRHDEALRRLGDS